MSTANNRKMETETSLSKRLSVALQNIKQQVSSTDKNLCKQALNISDATLKRYLNGEIANDTKAANMLAFLKEQIAKKEAAVAA